MTTSSGGNDGYHIDAGEDPGEAILRAVAGKKGCQVLELPPLQNAIDVEAMNRLLKFERVELLRFEYGGFDVTVEPKRVFLTALE